MWKVDTIESLYLLRGSITNYSTPVKVLLVAAIVLIVLGIWVKYIMGIGILLAIVAMVYAFIEARRKRT